MGKAGRKSRRHSTEFKVYVIMDMREHRWCYHETVLKHWGTKIHSEDFKYINVVKRWERILSEERAEGLVKEHRGKSYVNKQGRPPKLDKQYRRRSYRKEAEADIRA